MAQESARKIQSGNYPEDIKYLAKFNYHDSKILDVIYEKGMFTIVFNDYTWQRVSKYIFKAIKICCDISLSKLFEYQVLYEEVFFHPSDNLFEYNLLILKYRCGKEAD